MVKKIWYFIQWNNLCSLAIFRYGRKKKTVPMFFLLPKGLLFICPSEKVNGQFHSRGSLSLLEVLKSEGVTVVGDPIDESYGKFGWILDPEGNKIELWQPSVSWKIFVQRPALLSLHSQFWREFSSSWFRASALQAEGSAVRSRQLPQVPLQAGFFIMATTYWWLCSAQRKRNCSPALSLIRIYGFPHWWW